MAVCTDIAANHAGWREGSKHRVARTRRGSEQELIGTQDMGDLGCATRSILEGAVWIEPKSDREVPMHHRLGE